MNLVFGDLVQEVYMFINMLQIAGFLAKYSPHPIVATMEALDTE
jgi:hypothetical protein